MQKAFCDVYDGVRIEDEVAGHRGDLRGDPHLDLLVSDMTVSRQPGGSPRPESWPFAKPGRIRRPYLEAGASEAGQ